MAMTLRTGPDDEAALAKLAELWGVSKQQAALRAIRERAAEEEEENILALSDERASAYADALHRLGTL